MSDAPRRIWATCDTPNASLKSGRWCESSYGTQYTRTDLSEAAIAAAKAEGPRAVEMLRIAASFLRDVEPKGTAFYDGADCDCFCIADDCEAAADDMDAAAGDAP